MKNGSTNPKQPNKKKKKRPGAFWLKLLVVLVVVTIASAAFSYNYVIKTHTARLEDKLIQIDESEAEQITVPKGSGTADIAGMLKKEKFIGNENMFKILSKINGYDGRYKAGTHTISKNLNYDELMRVLTSESAGARVTIPEGKTLLQIADILFEKKVIESKEEFIKTANTHDFDYSFLKDLPERDNRLEGYLFPDTYLFDMSASDEEIITMMLNNFNSKFNEDYRKRVSEIEGMTTDDIVTLASIVEREAKTSTDREKISGVFYNRIKNKDKSLNRLQSCATIQYILLKETGAVKERLFEKDLAIDDPYNTYIYDGLPPGPICSPGEDAIKAALYPEETDYIYFVAKGDGFHEFSKTYDQHLEAINKYGLR